MWHFFSEHTKTFWRFMYGGGAVWTGILFIIPSHLSGLFLIVLKLIYAGALGFMTAMGKLLFDYYIENRKKNKQLKNKHHEKYKQNGQAGGRRTA